MKQFFRTVLAVVMVALSLASAAWGEVNVNVGIGIPIPGLRIELNSPPDFVMPSSLGFYVAVGTPYDLYRVNNNYYVFQNDVWYRGTYYNGPWQSVHYRQLPQSLRRHKHEHIRAIRDREYGHYRENRHSYKGKHFKPTKSWKESRRDNRQDDRRGDRKEKGHGRGN